MALLVIAAATWRRQATGVRPMHLSFEPQRGARHAGRSLVLVTGLAAALALGGCTMSETEQRTVSGAGIGAAVGAAGGALFGAIAGVPGTGAAIGAAAGAAIGGTGGYIHDQQVQRDTASSDAAALQRENEQLRRELAAQQQQQQ
jgi:hypothetical protein